jgi:hypothetical protein
MTCFFKEGVTMRKLFVSIVFGLALAPGIVSCRLSDAGHWPTEFRGTIQVAPFTAVSEKMATEIPDLNQIREWYPEAVETFLGFKKELANLLSSRVGRATVETALEAEVVLRFIGMFTALHDLNVGSGNLRENLYKFFINEAFFRRSGSGHDFGEYQGVGGFINSLSYYYSPYENYRVSLNPYEKYINIKYGMIGKTDRLKALYEAITEAQEKENILWSEIKHMSGEELNETKNMILGGFSPVFAPERMRAEAAEEAGRGAASSSSGADEQLAAQPRPVVGAGLREEEEEEYGAQVPRPASPQYRPLGNQEEIDRLEREIKEIESVASFAESKEEKLAAQTQIESIQNKIGQLRKVSVGQPSDDRQPGFGAAVPDSWQTPMGVTTPARLGARPVSPVEEMGGAEPERMVTPPLPSFSPPLPPVDALKDLEGQLQSLVLLRGEGQNVDVQMQQVQAEIDFLRGGADRRAAATKEAVGEAEERRPASAVFNFNADALIKRFRDPSSRNQDKIRRIVDMANSGNKEAVRLSQAILGFTPTAVSKFMNSLNKISSADAIFDPTKRTGRLDPVGVAEIQKLADLQQ